MTQESRLAIVIDSSKAKPSAEELTRAMKALDAAGVRVTSTTENVSQSMDRMAAQADSASRALRRGLIAAFGGISAMGIIDVADEWGQYASRIKMATESAEEYQRVQSRMLESANATYRNINETREAFIQLSPVLRQMGMSLDQSMDAIDTFSGLLVTNAASADRGAAAMRALSVAFQKGKVDADQWITIYSTVDSIVDLIAKSSGKSAEEIRKLGATGKLSVQMLIQALVEGYLPTMQKVEEMPTTVRDAMQRVGNAFSEYVGQSNEANQVTATLASGIKSLGDNLETILNAAVIASAAGLARYTLGMAAAATQTGVKLVQSRAAAIEELRLAQAQATQTAATLAQVSALRGLGASHAQATAATVAHEAATRRLAAAQLASSAVSRTLLSVLTGPAGIAVSLGLAALAFVDFGGSAAAANISLDGLTQSLGDLNKEQLAFRQQQAEEKLVHLEEKAADAARELRSLERDYAELAKMFSEGRGVDAAGLENVNKTLVEQRARLADANQEVERARGVLEQLDGAARAAAGGVSALNNSLIQTDEAGKKYLERLQDQSIVAGLKTQREQLEALVKAGKLIYSEGDLKAARDAAEIIDRANKLTGSSKSDPGKSYLDQIRERIALLGKETEYEKLLAQVAAGALTFRTAKQMELAKAEAQRLDAAEKAEELRKKEVDLGKEAEKRLADMQREIDLAGAIGEADKTRYEVLKGLYVTLPQSVKDSLVMKAEELDMTKRQIEIEKVLADLRAQQSTTQLQFMRELESFGQGDRVRELNASLAQVEDRYRSLIEQRRNSAQGLTETELAEIQKSLQIELDMVRDFHAKKLEIAQDWRLGARDALINYADDAANVYQSLGQTVSNAFKGMEDALVQFATKGKLDFKSLADSIISDMVRIAIQQNVTGPLGGLFGSMISAGIGALGGGGVSGASLPGIGGTAGGLLDNIKFSSGGYTGDGGRYEPAGIVHKGEGVLNQDEIRGIGGEAGFNALRRALRTGHAFGGMGGKPSLPPAVFGGAKKPEPSVVINSTVNAAPGTNAAELDAMLEQRNAELRYQILEDLRRGRVEI